MILGRIGNRNGAKRGELVVSTERPEWVSSSRPRAEGAAYVFDPWQTRLDARIKVHAAAFEVKRRWECGYSMG